MPKMNHKQIDRDRTIDIGEKATTKDDMENVNGKQIVKINKKWIAKYVMAYLSWSLAISCNERA